MAAPVKEEVAERRDPGTHLRQEVLPQQVDHHGPGGQRLARVAAQLRVPHAEVQLHLLYPVEEEEHLPGLLPLAAQQRDPAQVEVLPAHQVP